MKKIQLLIGFFVCCNSSAQNAFSLFNTGDSLYKAKDYKNSALYYGKAIRSELNPTVGKYWACACSWSLAGDADSAFYYLSFLERSKNVRMNDAEGIETDGDFTAIKSDKRWQPAINAIFENAMKGTKKLADDVRNGLRVNPAADRYAIALAWATTKNTDSTLHYLASIIYSKKNRYIDYNQLTSQKKFDFLKNHPKWQLLLNEINKYRIPFSCEHAPRDKQVPMTCIIDSSSKHLKSDGNGIYKNAENNVSSYFLTAYNLLSSGFQVLQQSSLWSDASQRYFSVDLNNPIKKSGAIKQGLIQDHFASFHAFYKIDTSVEKDYIYNLNQMPIGVTIESPRTDINIHINGKLHMLHFGFWGLGDCGEAYACGGKITGLGTSLIKITRKSENSYRIEAPDGSIGRLWDIDDRSHPVDKGLFEFSFLIHVEKQ